MRRLIALVARVFFRRIVVTGAEHVPRTGPILLLVNHPNSLVDPLLLFALAPRRVVFLAKEPLFHLPVVGWFTRALGSIPVYRRMDGADTTQNRRTFEKVWQELARGGAIGLFPEGTSHSDPRMRPFKTGAARMALGAASLNPGPPVRIVPGGLYYTSKVTFRSSAALCFGEAITVASEPLGPDGEPRADRVRALTAQLEDALARVTLQADQEDALRLVARAERIFSSVEGDGTRDRDLSQQVALRQRFLRGYTELRARMPRRIAAIEHLVTQYDAEITAAGLAPENMLDSHLTVATVARTTAVAVAKLIVLAPLGLAGVVIHAPAYWITVPLLTRAARVERDVLATAKIMAAAAVFPITWFVIAWFVWRAWGPVAAALAFAACPMAGYAALLFLEQLDRLVGSARGLSLRLLRPRAFRRLEAQRRKIREAILLLDGEI